MEDAPLHSDRPVRDAHKSASDLAKLFAGQIVSKIFGLLAFAWLARVLSPTEYGLVETVVGMSLIGFMCIEFGTGTIGIRSIARREKPAADIVRAVTSARLFLALVCAPLLVLVYGVLLWDQAPIALISLFALSLFANVVRHDWLFVAKERMGLAAIGTALKMAAFLAFILVLPPQSFGIVAIGWAELAAMAVMVLFFAVAVRRAGKVGNAWRTTETAGGLRMARESASLGVSGLVNTAAAALPILIVTVLASANEGGELGAALRIVISLSTFSLVYYQAFLPLLAARMQDAPEDAQRLLDASDRAVAWAGIGSGVFLFLAAEPILLIVFGEKLSGSIREFSIVLLTVPITLAYGGARLALIGQDRQKGVLKAQLWAAAITVAGSVLLAPRFGGEGGAIAVLLGHLALWAVTLWLGRSCAVRANWIVYGIPAAAGLLAIGVCHSLTVGPWLAALIGAGIVGLAAALSPELRRAVRLLMRAKSTQAE